jgi:hypothetical protein
MWTLFPSAMPHAPIWDWVFGGPFAPMPDTMAAYRSEYLQHLGYALGESGEWIAEAPAGHRARRQVSPR